MAEITAKLVKDLRDKTSAGMMDCKKALSETDGDMTKAAEWLRQKGIATAEKKPAVPPLKALWAAISTPEPVWVCWWK